MFGILISNKSLAKHFFLAYDNYPSNSTYTPKIPRFLPIHMILLPKDLGLLSCTTLVFGMYYSGTRHILLRYSVQVLE